MSDKDRAMQFRRGFGDGAKSGIIRFPEDLDYMTGHEQGRNELSRALASYVSDNGLAVTWDILRLAGGDL